MAGLEAAMQEAEKWRQDLERQLQAATRRTRAGWAAALLVTVGVGTLGVSPTARAQFGVTLTSLHNRLLAVENKTQDMSRLTDPNTGQPTVRFSGVNVQVVDGSGDTSGPVNGLGNLIVGYNGLRGVGDDRSGSHNLIVGDENDYSSFGSLVAGVTNTISGGYASVSGGNSVTQSTSSGWSAGSNGAIVSGRFRSP